MAVLLQSLDEDAHAENGIVITQEIHQAFRGEHIDLSTIDEGELQTIIEETTGHEAVEEDDAMAHVAEMLVAYDGIDADELPVLNAELPESVPMPDGDSLEVTQPAEDIVGAGTSEELLVADLPTIDEILDLGENEDEELLPKPKEAEEGADAPKAAQPDTDYVPADDPTVQVTVMEDQHTTGAV
jgi:hypothetical protein